MISSHPTAQKLHHMAILNKPLRPGDKSLLLISHSSTDSPCPSGTAPQRLRFPILRPWRGKWGLLSLTSHQRAPPHTHTSRHRTSSGVYLSEAAGVFLGLGGRPEQAGRHWGRPQLQRATEVRGVSGRAPGGGCRRRVMFLALGGQAELLGSPGEEKRVLRVYQQLALSLSHWQPWGGVLRVYQLLPLSLSHCAYVHSRLAHLRLHQPYEESL